MTQQPFAPDGVYGGVPYKVLETGQIDALVQGQILRFTNIEQLIAVVNKETLSPEPKSARTEHISPVISAQSDTPSGPPAVRARTDGNASAFPFRTQAIVLATLAMGGLMYLWLGGGYQSIVTHMRNVEPAQFQTAQEKLCVASAARDLSANMGTTATASRVRARAASAIANDIVEGLNDPMRAVRWLNAKFGYVKNEGLVKLMLEEGKHGQARRDLSKALYDKMQSGALVELDTRVAGQTSTFVFACAWDANTRTATWPLGMAR